MLNDPHEIDDSWFLQVEPERGERYVRDRIEVAETELSSPMRAQSGRLILVELCTTTVPLGEAEFFERRRHEGNRDARSAGESPREPLSCRLTEEGLLWISGGGLSACFLRTKAAGAEKSEAEHQEQHPERAGCGRRIDG